MIPIKNRQLNPAKYVLFVLPVVYILLSFYCYCQSKSFFTTYPDSIYIYLINGANIASGNFSIGHYDNPGTTAHLIAAVIIYITHLFSGSGPLLENVLSEPEFYLMICMVVMTLALAFCTLASGFLILKNTGKLSLAILFQLIPVSSYFGIHYLLLVRIVPETLILALVTYYSAFLFVLCYNKNDHQQSESSRKHILFFSLVTSFLIVSKITCLPFLVIPIILLKKYFDKSLFVLLTLLFSAIFMIPIWPHLSTMFHWFQKLATHSGQYGAGKEELLNISTFASNVILIFKSEVFFFIVYVLTTASVIAGFILKKWRNNLFKLTFSTWLVMDAQIFFAAKHFGYHYLLASESLSILALVSSAIVFIPVHFEKFVNYAILCASVVLFASKTFQSAKVYADGNFIYETSLGVKKYADLPRVITTGFQGSCFQESALRFGSAYGGQYFQHGNYILRKLYPKSYFYDIFLGGNYVKCWDITYTPRELFENNPKVLYYIMSWDEPSDKEIISHITDGLDSIIKNIKVIDRNEKTGERFYLIETDTNRANPHYSENISIKSELEKISPDKLFFLSTLPQYKFDRADQVSDEKHFSGNTSVKTSEEKPFACGAVFNVMPGDFFDISVKSYANDLPGVIVLSATDKNIFYKASESIVNEFANGWKTIQLKATIPADYPEKDVHFNLYYYGKKTCYFDDLSISIYKK